MINPEAEIQRPIQEFKYETRDAYVAGLIERLKDPTALGADLGLVTRKEFWYGEVVDDVNDPKQWEAFVAEYEKRVQENPMLAGHYVKIDRNWNAVPIVEDVRVNGLLSYLSEKLHAAGEYAREFARNQDEHEFGNHLIFASKRLPAGEFDLYVQNLLRQSVDLPIGWGGYPAEYLDDPFRRKGTYETWLHLTNKKRTERIKSDLKKFKEAAMRKYGVSPLDAKVVAARVVMLGGWLGEEGRKISGFNIPNDYAVSEEVGNNLVYLFPGRMAKKNEKRLSPALYKMLGIISSPEDIIKNVTGHEYTHGYRYPGEDERWGFLRGVGRELWATDRNIVLASMSEFSSHYFHSSLKGYLAFVADDLNDEMGDLPQRLWEPYGKNQLTLDELLKDREDHITISWIVARRAKTAGALNREGQRYNPRKLVELAEERDKELDKLAKGGNPVEARRYFDDLLEEKKFYLVDVESLPRTTSSFSDDCPVSGYAV